LIYIDLLDFAFDNLLFDCVLFTHINIGDVYTALGIRHVEQLVLVIPANTGKQAFIRVGHEEEFILVLAKAFDSLIIPNRKDTTLLLHYIKNLHYPKLVHASLLVSRKLELTLLPPVLRSFEVKK
jgi:hypothetical protein